MSARATGFIAAVLLFVADQAVKFLMIGPLQLQSRGVIHLLPVFDLRWAENRGVSMGMLQADSETGRWLLVALTAVLALAVLVWMLREKARGDISALGLILGGALGNIVDRVRFGYVVDYADFHIGAIRPFFIFNLADAAITIGVVILLARALFVRDKTAKSTETLNA